MTAQVDSVASSKTSLRGIFLLLCLEAALVICWSGGFIGVRFASEHAPIFLILLWRSLVSGLVLLPFALMIGPPVRWQKMRAQILFGALGMAGYLGGFALAIAYGMPTALVALIADMLPLMVAALSWPMLGQALTGRQWLGSLLGLSGVLIASGWALSMGEVPLRVYGLPIAGTLSLAVSTLMQKRDPSSSMPLHQSLCIQCLTAAAIFSGFAWHEGGVSPVLAPGFIGGIVWLVFVATFGGWGLYFLALRVSSPTRVTSVLYLSPPVVMIWAWLMFDEPISWAMAAGLSISLSGIVLVARTQRHRAAVPAS